MHPPTAVAKHSVPLPDLDSVEVLTLRFSILPVILSSLLAHDLFDVHSKAVINSFLTTSQTFANFGRQDEEVTD